MVFCWSHYTVVVVGTVKEALFLVWVLPVYAGRLWIFSGMHVLNDEPGAT